MLEDSVALVISPLASLALFLVGKVLPKTWNYELKDGHQTVYRGITKNPSRRFAEHRRDGKRFTHARIIGWSFFRAWARRREVRALAEYRRAHGGRNPRYNRRDRG
jgi:hypothetical protein